MLIVPKSWFASESLVLTHDAIYTIQHCVHTPSLEKGLYVRHVFAFNCKVTLDTAGITLLHFEKPSPFTIAYPTLQGFLKFDYGSFSAPQVNDLIVLKYENEVDHDSFMDNHEDVNYCSIRGV